MDPELTAKMKDPELYMMYCRAWLEEKYGFDNIVATTIHREESEPHIHVIVTPIKQKKVKWKNAKGEGERIENRLCARDFTGEKALLEKMQDDFHAFTKNFGSKFGVEFYRGLKASEQLKVYTKKTDHTIGLLRKEMNEIKEKSRALGLEIRTDIYDYNQMVDKLSKDTENAKLEFTEAHRKNEEMKNTLMQYTNEAYEINRKIQEQERLLKEEQSRVAAQEQKRQRVNTSVDENGIARWKKGEEYFHTDKPKQRGFGGR
jgi:chromosome segregation ATPase